MTREVDDRPPELVDRLEKLYTAVVADVLDRLGYRNQSLRPEIRPLFPQARAAGYALTVHTVPARSSPPPSRTRASWPRSTPSGRST